MYSECGGLMKKFAFLLFLFCAGVFAQSKPNDYSITVHVTASRTVVEPSINHVWLAQKLNATIDGKKYELEYRSMAGISLLRVGDYRAKLEDSHKNSYEIKQVYEFQFVDGKTRRFDVVGMEE
jgi:hypothetical protein